MNPKFKIGQTAKTLPNYQSIDINEGNYGGAGYIENSPRLIINKVVEGRDPNKLIRGNKIIIYFFENVLHGIYEFALIGIETIRNENIDKILE